MDESSKLIEQTIHSKRVFNGNLLHVYADTVLLPNGSETAREWIDHPGASAALPVFENGDVMLVKQFRYPFKKIFHEVPAGKIDAGESPELTVRRETREETGLHCNSFQYLGVFHPSIGYTNEIIHLYVAWDITVHDQKAEEDEFVIRRRLPFQQAVDMVYNGEITDGKSIVTILKANHWWIKNKPFQI